MKDFAKFLDQLLKYKEEFGDYYVSRSYITDDGSKLGVRVNNVRHGRYKLDEYEMQELDRIGFCMKYVRKKEKLDVPLICSLLKQYEEIYGDMLVPRTFVYNGVKLGAIVRKIRLGAYELSPEEVSMLNETGFVWKAKKGKKKIWQFKKFYQEVLKYKEKYGDCEIKIDYVTDEGFRLGNLAYKVRNGIIELSEEERQSLNDIDFIWKMHRGKRRKLDFDNFCKMILEYKEETGITWIPANYVTKTGFSLGKLANSIRKGYIKVTAEERYKLESIGFTWSYKNARENLNRELDLTKR